MLANSELVCFAVVCLAHGITGYGTGAPASACTTLTPVHSGISASTSPSPFTLSVSELTYSAGSQITVTIVGDNFQGFLVQARKIGENVPVGTFTSAPSNTQLLECSAESDSWTHSSTAVKENETITWTAPSTDMGTIAFIATVARNKQTYWLNHRSANLSYTEPGSPGPTNNVTPSGSPSNDVTGTTPVNAGSVNGVRTWLVAFIFIIVLALSSSQ